MAASIINKVSHFLRNAFIIPKNDLFLSKICTESLKSPWQHCQQIRACSTDKQYVNKQKRLLTWATNRDWNNRKLVKEHGLERQRLSVLAKNRILPADIKELASEQLHALPRRSSITHTFPRCIITGKSRSRLKRWRLSRIQWRHFADYNNISGVMRAQW